MVRSEGPAEGTLGLPMTQGSLLVWYCPSRAHWSGSVLSVRGTGPWRHQWGRQEVVRLGCPRPDPQAAEGWQQGRDPVVRVLLEATGSLEQGSQEQRRPWPR